MELSEEQKQLLKQLKNQLATNILIQAKVWDSPELANLILLVKNVFRYTTDSIFCSLLLRVQVLNVGVIAALQELDVTFLEPKIILASIQSLAETEENFINLYDDALSSSVIDVSDDEMTCKLKEITVDFTENSILKILHVSCEYANTYEELGTFLRDFCHGLEKEKASSYILKAFASLKDYDPEDEPEEFFAAMKRGDKCFEVGKSLMEDIRKYIVCDEKEGRYEALKETPVTVSKKRSREESPAVSDFSGFDEGAEVQNNIITNDSSEDEDADDESSDDNNGDDEPYVQGEDDEDNEDDEEDFEGEDEDDDEDEDEDEDDDEDEDEDEDKKKKYKRTMKYSYSTDEES